MRSRGAWERPGDPDTLSRLNQAFWDASPNSFSGRRLGALLHDAGLEVDSDVGSSAAVLPDEAIRRGGMAARRVQRAVAAGLVTAAAGAAFPGRLREAVDRGTAFRAVTMFGVVARR